MAQQPVSEYETWPDVSKEPCGACDATGVYVSPWGGVTTGSCLACAGTGYHYDLQMPARGDEALLHEIVRLAGSSQARGAANERERALQRIEGLARALLLRQPEPPMARVVPAVLRAAVERVQLHAEPLSRDAQAVVDFDQSRAQRSRAEWQGGAR